MNVFQKLRRDRAETGHQDASVIVVGGSTLLRQCLIRCLSEPEYQLEALGFETIGDWLQSELVDGSPIVLLLSPDVVEAQASIGADLEHILRDSPGARIVIGFRLEGPGAIVAAFQSGAKGYLPPDPPLDMNLVVAVVSLVRAGGFYMPSSSITLAQVSNVGAGNGDGARACQTRDTFTARQMAIARCVRRGDSNKIIARKLDIAESTVKVHVRKIMHKLNARSRTEIFFLTRNLFDD